MQGRFKRGGRKGPLGANLGARFVERLARVVEEPPRVFAFARDERERERSVPGERPSVRVRQVVRHETIEPVAGQILFLAGPTASGKSALALAAAEALGAEIVNADSMQVYTALEALSARPSAEDLERVPHHLYGHVDADESYSVGRWRDEAVAALKEIAQRGRPAIVVGGTGLYFKSLTDGLADVPDPGPEAEAFARDLLNRGGVEALRAMAEQLDPRGVAQVGATDRQRLLRLVAVARGVGRPLSELRETTAPPVLPGAWRALVLEPDRAHLYNRIDARTDRMLAEGAAEEALALSRRGLDPTRSAMKALGVGILTDYAEGRIGRAEAVAALAQDTRRYAKRQMTWFRNQTGDWPRIATINLDAALAAWRSAPSALGG